MIVRMSEMLSMLLYWILLGLESGSGSGLKKARAGVRVRVRVRLGLGLGLELAPLLAVAE